MADLLPSRRRAERFARLVDGDESVEDAALSRLAGVADALGTLPRVQPDEQFRDSLRARLVEAAETELAPPQAVRPPRRHRAPRPVGGERRRRKLVALAGSLVILGGMSGVAAASQQALPGDTLYPVKRGLERIEMGIAGDQRAAGHELLERAESRLTEVHSLVAGEVDDARGREDVTRTLQDFTADAGRGAELLVAAHRSTGNDADLVQVRTFTREAANQLTELSGDVPAESEPALQDAMAAVESIDRMALRACPDCTSRLPAVDLDLLSLPQAGDTEYLVPEENAGPSRSPAPAESDEREGSQRQGSDDATQPSDGDGQVVDPEDDDLLPLPDLPDGPLDGNDRGSSPSPTPSGEGTPDRDGPVLGDDGLLGTRGPVLGDEGLAGTDGPLLGRQGVLGSDGPVRGEQGLLGEKGLLGGLSR